MLRARVHERLARAARYPVTLVVAPAGFGKSTALRDYLATARVEAVRYDVLRADATLLAFVRGLATALGSVAPAALSAYPAAQQRVLASDDPVRELADWLVEHLRRVVCTVVVDDLHYAHPDAVRVLVDVIERTEGRVTWIVASRSDVGLPVATWVGYGRADVPVGEDDLRFTIEEALAVADDASSELDAHEAEALRELTAGWPIALTIALRTRTHAADLRHATHGTREMISRYLAEQVLAPLDDTQRAFLISTSILPTFDREVVKALGLSPDAFDALRRAVTFLTETAPGVFRYHDLFRDVLEGLLRAQGEHAVREAYAGAAAIYQRRGDDARTLALATGAGDAAMALATLERGGLALIERGEIEIVDTALQALPQTERAASAAAIGLGAIIDAARGRFDLAEPAFSAAIARAEDLTLRLALVQRYALELVRAGRDAVAFLTRYAGDASLPPATRAALLGTLATAEARAGRYAEARTTAERAVAALEDPFAAELRARVYQQAAFVHQYGPDPSRARRYAEAAVELALPRGLFEIAARAYSAIYIVVADETDDPIAALAVLDKLRECARKAASRQVRLYGTIVAYAIEAERGDELALDALDAELSGEPLDGLGTVATEALLPARALRAAWAGDFPRAYAMLAGTAAAQTTPDRRALRAAEIALFATTADKRDEGDAALAEAAAGLAESPESGARVARTHTLLALAELARGRAPAAHRRLADAERALTPATRRLRAFVHAVRARYRRMLGQGDDAAYVTALERLRAEHGAGLARLLEALPLRAHDEPGYGALTPAEREILALLVQGGTSKDVAARTGRSPQTVDVHIRSLCRKLGCNGRREAVALAMKSGWTAPA